MGFITNYFRAMLNPNPNLKKVKYRDTLVDITNFAEMDFNDDWGKFGKAWYDEENEYLLIETSSGIYHYVDVPEPQWHFLSTGKRPILEYKNHIKKQPLFDARTGNVPSYK